EGANHCARGGRAPRLRSVLSFLKRKACVVQQLGVDVIMLCRDKAFGVTTSRLRFVALGLFLFVGSAVAADLEQCRKMFLSGEYTNCIRAAEGAIRDQVRDEEWPLLLMQSLLAVGRYPEADSALTDALRRYRYSIRLRVLGAEVLSANGNPDRPRAWLEEINFGS